MTAIRRAPWQHSRAARSRRAAGAPAGLRELYDRHGPACFAMALFLTGDRARAEDVVAGAFLAVWQHRDHPGCQQPGLRTRLLTVTHQRAVAMRRRDKLPQPGITGCEQLLIQPLGGRQPQDQNGIPPIRAALVLLTGPERQTLALAYFGGCTQAEIAAITGVPLAIVRSRTLTAMRRLPRRTTAQP